MKKVISILLLCSIIGKAQNYDGYTQEEIEQIHKEFSQTQQWSKGGDATRYVNLHRPEFWPHQTINKKGEARRLDIYLRSDVANFELEKEGKQLPLSNYVNDPLIDGMLIIHKGKIVFEAYPNMYDYDKHHCYSTTKPFVAAAIALLEEEGRIDVNKTVGHYIPELKQTDWENIPVIDVLDMSSGMGLDITDFKDFFFNENGWIGSDTSKGGPFEQVGHLKKTGPSGTIYEYFSVNTEVLGWILEAVTNQSGVSYIQNNIWHKMGAESDAFMFLTHGYDPVYMGGLSMTLRDLARFGLLFTPSGSQPPYDIIPDTYLKKIQEGGRPEIVKNTGPIDLFVYDKPLTKAHLVDGEPSRHATYQWDIVMNDGDFFKEGAGGQGIYISPGRDLVIVYFGTHGVGGDESRIINDLPKVSRQLAKSGLFEK